MKVRALGLLVVVAVGPIAALACGGGATGSGARTVGAASGSANASASAVGSAAASSSSLPAATATGKTADLEARHGLKVENARILVIPLAD